jgi:hypothetical protein
MVFLLRQSLCSFQLPTADEGAHASCVRFTGILAGDFTCGQDARDPPTGMSAFRCYELRSARQCSR